MGRLTQLEEAKHLVTPEWEQMNEEVREARIKAEYLQAKADDAKRKYEEKRADLTSLAIRIKFKNVRYEEWR